MNMIPLALWRIPLGFGLIYSLSVNLGIGMGFYLLWQWGGSLETAALLAFPGQTVVLLFLLFHGKFNKKHYRFLLSDLRVRDRICAVSLHFLMVALAIVTIELDFGYFISIIVSQFLVAWMIFFIFVASIRHKGSTLNQDYLITETVNRCFGRISIAFLILCVCLPLTLMVLRAGNAHAAVLGVVFSVILGAGIVAYPNRRKTTRSSQ